MTRDEIINAIRNQHVDFLSAIGGIPDDAMVNTLITEQWTIKDMMAHIAIWMRVAIKFIREFKADGVPKSLGLSDDDKLNAFNEQGFRARQDTPLPEVIEEFQLAYRELIEDIESLTDLELSQPLPAPWEEGDTLEKLIAINSYEHEPEHTLQVYTWREAQDEEDE